MKEFQRTWAVNWQDGMLLTNQHFNDTQRYLDDTVRRALGGVAVEYGLIPDDRLNPSYEVILDWTPEMVKSNAVQVRVMSCRGMAPDGSLIFIYRKAYDLNIKYVGLKEIIDSGRHKYSVFVTAKEDGFIEVGSENDESGGWFKYRIPDYEVTIAGTETSKQNALKIGQIIVNNNEVAIDDRYIPPCVSMSCHRRLMEYAKEFHTGLRDLLPFSAECYRRLQNRQTPQGVFTMKDPEAAILLVFSRHMAQRIADTFDDFRDEVSRSSPRKVVIFFKSLFRNVDLALKLAGENAKQLLASLWSRHLDSQFLPAEFDQAMDHLHKTAYYHEHIGSSMSYISYLLNQYVIFFRILLSKVWSDQPIESVKPPPLPPPPEPPKPQPKPKAKPKPVDDFLLLDVEKDESGAEW